MHISLTEKLDEYVRDKVASGLYNNASEVIREALDPAWRQADAGACVPFDLTAILDELDQETAHA